MACSIQAQLDTNPCYACLLPFQQELVKTAFYCQVAEDDTAECNVPALLIDASCYACLSWFQLRVLQTQLLCAISENGGGGDEGLLTEDGDFILTENGDNILPE